MFERRILQVNWSFLSVDKLNNQKKLIKERKKSQNAEKFRFLKIIGNCFKGNLFFSLLVKLDRNSKLVDKKTKEPFFQPSQKLEEFCEKIVQVERISQKFAKKLNTMPLRINIWKHGNSLVDWDNRFRFLGTT